MGALRELVRSYERRDPDALERMEDFCAGNVECSVDTDGRMRVVWTRYTTLGAAEAK